MSRFLMDRKLVFRPSLQFDVNIKGMSREEKIEKMNSFSKHDRYQVTFKGDFIHLLDKFSVKKGEWLSVECDDA